MIKNSTLQSMAQIMQDKATRGMNDAILVMYDYLRDNGQEKTAELLDN
jgi:hypothetical protein